MTVGCLQKEKPNTRIIDQPLDHDRRMPAEGKTARDPEDSGGKKIITEHEQTGSSCRMSELIEIIK